MIASPESIPGRTGGNEDGKPARRLVPIVGFVLLTVLYIATAPTNRTEADDAFWYAWDVERQPWSALFQPFHLFYLPLGRLAWLAVQALGATDRAYPVLAVAGAVAAAAAVLISWATLVSRLEFDRTRAALACGLLAFSYGFWRYAAEAEVYAMALLWCAALVNLALAARLDRGGFVALVLLGATAPLVHILSAALAGVAVPVAIALRRGIRSAAGYLVAAGGVGLIVASAGFRMAGPSAGGLLGFYSGGQSVWAIGGLGGAARHAIAASQVVVSGNFILSYQTVRDRIAGWFPTRMLADEIYAGEHAAAAIRFLAPLTLSLLVAAAVWFAYTGWWQRGSRARGAALALASVWLLMHIGLGVMFSPGGQPEVWMLALLPAWMLVVCLLIPSEGRNWPLVALVAGLFVHNLVGGLWVYDDPDGDRGRAKGIWLIENTNPEDVILTADSPVFARYLRYWAPGTVIDLQFRDSGELRDVWTEVLERPGSVYATGDVFRPPAYYRVLRPVEADDLDEFGRGIQDEFRQIVPDEFGGIWQRGTTAGDHRHR